MDDMTRRRFQIGAVTYVILGAAALVNMLFLQPHLHTSNAATAPALLPAPAAKSSPPAAPVALIASIQRELETLSYAVGTPNGTVTLTLRAAILAYEADHGLPLTATPTEDLLRSIVLGPAGGTDAHTTPDGVDATRVISTVQHALSSLGYKTTPQDGRLSEATATAVRAFEHDHGLTPSGRISGTTVIELARLGVLPKMTAR